MTKLIDLRETALYFGKDTSRKRKIFFKKCIVELDYVIDHIEPQIKKKGVAHHHGEILYPRDLRSIKAERDLIINSFEELTK
jgi:hypothetical protein